MTIEYEGHAAALNHTPADRRRAGRPDVAADGGRQHGQRRRSPRATTASTWPRPCTTAPSEYQTLVRITVETDKLTRSVAGTLFAGSRPRIVEIKGIKVEADFAPHMLYVTNQDKPGFIGRFGATLAGAGINIATFHLGRAAPGRRRDLPGFGRRTRAGGRAGDGAHAAAGDAGDGAGVLIGW